MCVRVQIDLQATTGYKDFIFGGEATFDTNKQDVTKWSAGVGVFHHSLSMVASLSYHHIVHI